MDNFPLETLNHIGSYLDEVSKVMVYDVSLDLRKTMGLKESRKDLCSLAAEKGYLGVLKFLKEKNYPWNEETCSQAARRGHLEVLKYLREMVVLGLLHYILYRGSRTYRNTSVGNREWVSKIITNDR